MTFDGSTQVSQEGETASLRHELDAGLSPDLSNQFSWTLLMLSASEGNPADWRTSDFQGADTDKANDFGDTAPSLAGAPAILSLSSFRLPMGPQEERRPHGTTLEDSPCFVRPSSRQVQLVLTSSAARLG